MQKRLPSSALSMSGFLGCDEGLSPWLGGEQLRLALGFRTGEAFRAAVRGGRIPVPLIKIKGRKGWFAQRVDVSAWTASVAVQAHSHQQSASAHSSTKKVTAKEK